MSDRVLLSSPVGLLVLTSDQLREAVARGREMAVALNITPRLTSTPATAEQQVSWFTVEEVANRTNLKKSWLYQEIRANRIPHRHFGKQVRIPGSYLTEPDPKSDARQPGGQ